ncbi:MAG: hypothetical protein ABS95_02925 [Verrucomicrobia bacterium SCN 57-15]|nr:MAG: hypothetical protein ABS95_02925 [Verrucomicrobia bacterium SCN 57-15]
MKKLTLLIATAVGVLTTPALLAQMNHDMGGMNHGDHSAHQHGGNTQTAQTPLPEPVKTVFDNYLKIQADLAQDFLQGVHDSKALKDRALAIAEAVRNDPNKTFSTDLVQQAETLSKATDLKTAREAFRPLSDSLIKYLGAHKDQAGNFEKVFCSMANARWLQKAGSAVNNPYMGKSMARCGQIES